MAPVRFLAMCALLVTITAAAARADFNYPDFTSSAGLDLYGNARPVGARLRLADAYQNNHGVAWHQAPQAIAGFWTQFSFQVAAPAWPAADGIWFIIRPDQPTAGSDGFAANTASVELDMFTWAPKDDPVGNHAAVFLLDELDDPYHHSNALGSTTAIPNLQDGQVHTVRIHYESNIMRVYIDDLATPRLTVDIDLPGTGNFPDGRAYVGLMGVSEFYFQDHDILDWSFTEIPEPAAMLLLLAGAAALRRWSPHGPRSPAPQQRTGTAGTSNAPLPSNGSVSWPFF